MSSGSARTVFIRCSECLLLLLPQPDVLSPSGLGRWQEIEEEGRGGGGGLAQSTGRINRLAGLKTNIDADTQLDVTGIM